MDRGFVKIFRDLLGHEIASDCKLLSVFMHLMMDARWQEQNKRAYKLEEGESDLTQGQIMKLANLSRQEVRTALEKLSEMGTISNRFVNQRRIVRKLVNWRYWQHEACNDNQDSNRKSTTPKEGKKKTNNNDGTRDFEKDFDGLGLYLKDDKLRKKWNECYDALKTGFPTVDIIPEIRKAHAWEVNNPRKRKTNRPSFFNNWFTNAAARIAKSEAYYAPRPSLTDMEVDVDG